MCIIEVLDYLFKFCIFNYRSINTFAYYQISSRPIKTSVTNISDSSFATVHSAVLVANVAQSYDCELLLAFLAIDGSCEVVFFNIDNFVLDSFLEKYLLL